MVIVNYRYMIDIAVYLGAEKETAEKELKVFISVCCELNIFTKKIDANRSWPSNKQNQNTCLWHHPNLV